MTNLETIAQSLYKTLKGQLKTPPLIKAIEELGIKKLDRNPIFQ
ncbi:hypothetical protein JCM15765_16950 [Paradesulfitobacterium aromaticivorans]